MTSIIQTTKLVMYENMESENAYIWSQIKASGSGQLVFSCDSGHCFSAESAFQHKRKHPFVGPLKKKKPPGGVFCAASFYFVLKLYSYG